MYKNLSIFKSTKENLKILLTMPVILATQEAQIRRIAVQSQPGQTVRPYLEKNPSQKRAVGVAQGIDPKYNPQYTHTQKKRQREREMATSLLGLPS
jgi:hypothetical protein